MHRRLSPNLKPMKQKPTARVFQEGGLLRAGQQRIRNGGIYVRQSFRRQSGT
jgi:hypothetical protein